MREYIWLCESCRTIGASYLRPGMDLYDLIDLIVVSHHYLSPACLHWLEDIQAINTPLVASRRDLEEHVPLWALRDVASVLGY